MDHKALLIEPLGTLRAFPEARPALQFARPAAGHACGMHGRVTRDAPDRRRQGAGQTDRVSQGTGRGEVLPAAAVTDDEPEEQAVFGNDVDVAQTHGALNR
jgi:hypothetical protein